MSADRRRAPEGHEPSSEEDPRDPNNRGDICRASLGGSPSEGTAPFALPVRVEESFEADDGLIACDVVDADGVIIAFDLTRAEADFIARALNAPRSEGREHIEGWAAPRDLIAGAWEFAEDVPDFTPGPRSMPATLTLRGDCVGDAPRSGGDGEGDARWHGWDAYHVSLAAAVLSKDILGVDREALAGDLTKIASRLRSTGEPETLGYVVIGRERRTGEVVGVASVRVYATPAEAQQRADVYMADLGEETQGLTYIVARVTPIGRPRAPEQKGHTDGE